MQSNDIKQILALVREKDPAGFELLYQHYFRFLFSIAYSVRNNEADSYDVVQSVMMRLYQLDETLFPRDHELSWLRTMVRNEALMHLRKSDRSPGGGIGASRTGPEDRGFRGYGRFS